LCDDARLRAFSLGQNTERGRPARQARSAGVPPAKTKAGKIPALQRGIGLNAARESGSAGVPPAKTKAGKMPALQKGIGLYAATATTPVNGRRRCGGVEADSFLERGHLARFCFCGRDARAPGFAGGIEADSSLERGDLARFCFCGRDARAPGLAGGTPALRVLSQREGP